MRWIVQGNWKTDGETGAMPVYAKSSEEALRIAEGRGLLGETARREDPPGRPDTAPRLDTTPPARPSDSDNAQKA